MTKVKCKVDSCHYWGNGDVCKADSIMVDNNRLQTSSSRLEAGDLNPDLRRSEQAESAVDLPRFGDFEVASLDTDLLKANAGSDSSASTSEETLCRTFRPKGSPSRN